MKQRYKKTTARGQCPPCQPSVKKGDLVQSFGRCRMFRFYQRISPTEETSINSYFHFKKVDFSSCFPLKQMHFSLACFK